MKFLSTKHEPLSAEDAAFAERLSAIANRGRGITKPESPAEIQPSCDFDQPRWSGSGFDRGEQPATA